MQTPPQPTMGEGGDNDKSDYQSLREARVSENQARMETLGLRRAARELNEMAVAPTPRRSYVHKQYATGPPRRSPRLNRQSAVHHHKALPLKGCLGKVMAAAVREAKEEENDMRQQQEAPVVGKDVAPALQDSDDEGMGSVYDDAVPGSPVLQPAGG